ncbi:LamG-like jellyroll fold domain-containing protein [Lentzea aerocolonigenes]|uniref:LamG-like jellyroll fold domain-containing protein n=1 Tax=Lentzea aerocolonigenes TaxID=68170 RepID=UPI0009DD8C0B|nr:LamG-like jellyroll fold domain-containing protein [Lentzea aerocolonigenes]MCP2246205.1 Concanavalin A-like lectin/glucanases superfamily protein [Lentzea aerocolonigenes]
MRIARGRSSALPAFTAAIVFTGTLIGSVATASAAVPDEVADPTSAEKLAKQSGKSIVIGSKTTEESQVKANPDGSRTLITHTHPVRVKQNGAWAAVDLNLVPQADGSLAPKAAPVAMSFTAGGVGSAAKPVARLIKGDAEVGFGWDADLPPAQISGQTATYREVLPGVDLEVQATLTGFSQNLVVKTAEAAKSSRLQKITFKSHTKNTKITGPSGVAARSSTSATTPTNGLVVTGPDGSQVFSGDASRMWDSSASARQGVMGVEVGRDTISVTPDQSFLSDPNTTYPVRLDPDYYCTSCSKAHHAVVQSPWPKAPNYDVTSGDLGDLKAGYLNAGSLGASTAGVSRTYFEMHTADIVGKHIHSATLHAKVIASFSCSPTPTELWLTNGIGPDTTWNNQPGWIRRLSENNVKNNPGHCATDGGADFDATSAVAEAASTPWWITAFMFKAKDEQSLDDSWRRFDLNPYLEVNYNSYPNKPVDLGIEGWGPNAADAIPCRIGANRPYVATRTPRLRARLSDPDGGRMDAGFRLMVGTHDKYTWNGQDIHTGDVPSGSFAEVTVPNGWISNDGIHSFQLWSGDYESSSWSQLCEFMVDTTKPNTPAVSSSDYPETGINGSVGRTGSFTFSPNGNTGPDNTMDVARYGWSLNVDTYENQVDVTNASGVVTVPITPAFSANTLYLQAYDKAGNPAAHPRKYVFNVADPSGPVAAWNFNETSGATAADITGKGRPLTLNGATFGSGYAGNGQINTTSSFSKTSSAVVDTSRAFSVSAWVKLTKTDGDYTIASQDADHVSSFFLEYVRDVNRWSFGAGGSVRVVSSAPPEVGVWTHLVGTYEPNTRKLSLYVNGKPEGTVDATLGTATGPFVVGAALWPSGRVHHLPGTIDHVQVWDRVLDAAEAAKQNNFVVLRSHYNLDERTGATTKDEVTGQNATVTGEGARWAGTPVDPDDPNQILTSKDKWLNFDSSQSGEVTAPRPANLRTDRSYTVSAWVRHGGLDSSARAAVAMGDTTHSPFVLGYRPETGKWGFLLTQTSSGGGVYALSDGAAQPNVWVHLAATFDATSGTITLYVNGIKQTTFSHGSTGLQTFNASGDVWVGRAVWEGRRSDMWKGDVDDARIYSGAMSDQNVRDLFSATNHF